MSDKDPQAAIYARISDDRENDQQGVTRQLKDGRALVQSRGGTVVMERVDNDISATTGKHRPGYDAIMEAAEAGLITHIVIWQTSRLWRSRRERADGIERLAKARVSVLAVKGPDLDMTTAYGRGMAGLVGEFDTMESEVKSERIRRKVIELAEDGKIANGGPRPFGYKRIFEGEGRRRRILRDEVDEPEAAIIRDCAERLLSGDSLRGIVADLNKLEVKTSTGRPWTIVALRGMLRSGRIAGLREHRGVTVGKAVWPAIVDVETHEQLRAKLDSNERPPGNRARVHYLSGFVYCSSCVLKMRPKPAHDKLVYCCPPKAEGGCGGRVIGLAKLQKMIDVYMAGDRDLGVVGRLSDPQLLRELAERESVDDTRAKQLLEQIEADERRLAVLQEDLTEGDEDELPEVLAATRRIRRRIGDSRAELARLVEIPPALHESLPDLAGRWSELHLDRKQSLLRLFVEKIVIAPAVRGRNYFDPDRVDIIPRKWGR